MRMEFFFGYGELDQYNLKGGVQFFQTCLQLTLVVWIKQMLKDDNSEYRTMIKLIKLK